MQPEWTRSQRVAKGRPFWYLGIHAGNVSLSECRSMIPRLTRHVHVVVAVVVLSFSIRVPLPAQSPSVSRLLDSVSQAHLSGHIQTLARAGGHYNRVSYTPGNDSAVAYIYDTFRRIPGLTYVRLDTFLVSQATTPYNTRPLFNVVATLGGRADPAKQILLGAHLDCSASRDSTGAWTAEWATMRVPGADDNATGVAVILELARLLATPAFGCLNDYTVTFVAFGAEESTPPYAGKISHPGSRWKRCCFGIRDIVHWSQNAISTRRTICEHSFPACLCHARLCELLITIGILHHAGCKPVLCTVRDAV